MSSDFSSDFPTVKKNKSYVCGDGHCKIDVERHERRRVYSQAVGRCRRQEINSAGERFNCSPALFYTELQLKSLKKILIARRA